MPTWLSPLLACFSACAVTYYRLYTSDKFHSFYFLISRHWLVALQAGINALVALILLLCLKDKVITVTKDATTIGDYLYPLMVGALAKGISDINLFNVKTDGFTFPFGLRSITQPVDKFFEEKLDGICFPKTQKYMARFNGKYSEEFAGKYHGNMVAFKEYVTSQLDLYYRNKPKVAAFKQSREFKAAKTVDELLVQVLQEFGPTVFQGVFPL
jgi:hypothetical protein